MSLVFMSGFEWGTTQEFDQVGGSVVTSPKRSGSYSASLGNGNWVYKILPQPLTEVYVQFAYYTSWSSSAVFFVISKGGNDIISINKDGSYRLQVCSGYGGTVYCTGITPIQLNVWYLIELHFKMADTGGIIELRLDGTLEATFYGDTKPGADASFDKMSWGATTGVTNFYLDDVVIFDTFGSVNNSWPNGLKIKLLKPTADGPVNDWDVNPSGAHYAAIDEVHPSSTDYIKTSTADEIEHFDMENLPAEALSVKAVQVQAFCLKGAFMDPDRIRLGVRINNTDYFSDPIDLPSSSMICKYTLDQNPAGGNWTVDAVNNAKMALQAVN